MNKIVLTPQCFANDTQAQVTRWLAPINSYVNAGTPVVELAYSKANLIIETEYSGYVLPLCNLGSWVSVSAPLFAISPSPSLQKAQDIEASPTQSSQWVSNKYRTLYPQENSYSEKDSDFLRVSTLPSNSGETGAQLKSDSLSDEQKMQISALTYGHNEAVSSSISLSFSLNKLPAHLKQQGLDSSWLNSILLLEIHNFAKNNPMLNSFISDDEIIYYQQSCLGLVMPSLTMPIVFPIEPEKCRNLKILNSAVLEAGIYALSIPAKIFKPSRFPTYTISSLISQEVDFFIPNINHNQSVTFGISGTLKTTSDWRITLSATYDHRLINGYLMAKWLNSIRGKILKYDSPDFLDSALANCPEAGVK